MQGKKQQQIIGLFKIFLLKHNLRYEYNENWKKLSIKMFKKRKTRAGKTYAYRIFLTFKFS